MQASAPFLEELDRATIYVTYLALWVALIAGQRPDENLVSSVGALLITAGAVLSFLAIRKLGRWHNEYITPVASAPLATSGIYGWMRHPMRTGFFVEVTGLTVVLGRPWAVAAWLGIAILLALRTRREERLLMQHYDETYRSYRRRVPVLPLFILRIRDRASDPHGRG